MNELMVKEDIVLYKIRDKYVILDSDIAKLYGIETKVLNQVVKRNIDRFTYDVYFKLLDEEYDDLRSQAVTSKIGDNRGGRRYLPYVFTRDGVSILGSIKLETQKPLIIKGESIENVIVEIRGRKVIFDYDLASLYECKNGTKEINQAVKNNPEKFPDNYMFQLTKEEATTCSRSKILTLNEGR